MELNADHALVDTMQGLFDANAEDTTLVDYAHLLYGQALIAEGASVPDPAGFGSASRQLNGPLIVSFQRSPGLVQLSTLPRRTSFHPLF